MPQTALLSSIMPSSTVCLLCWESYAVIFFKAVNSPAVSALELVCKRQRQGAFHAIFAFDRDKFFAGYLPAGTGVLATVQLTVLGQSGAARTQGLAYQRPHISSISPTSWSTDVTGTMFTLSGSGFGSQLFSSKVVLQILGNLSHCSQDNPAGAPNNGSVVFISAIDVVVVSDSTVTFRLPTEPPHVIASWIIEMSVSNQSLTSDSVTAVNSLPPSISSLTFSTLPNGTHYFITITGADFGSSVSNPDDGNCDGDVLVTIDSKPCQALTIAQVSTRTFACPGGAIA